MLSKKPRTARFGNVNVVQLLAPNETICNFVVEKRKFACTILLVELRERSIKSIKIPFVVNNEV